MPLAPPPVSSLLLPAGLLAGPCLAEIAQGEDTSIQNLAWHDGMVIFNGALRKAIPPNATSAADPAAVAVPCGCSDAAPRDTSGGVPPFLVTTDCFFLAADGNCNASFMQVGAKGKGAGGQGDSMCACVRAWEIVGSGMGQALGPSVLQLHLMNNQLRHARR